MKFHKISAILILSIFIFPLPSKLYAQSTKAEPYSYDEFPDILHKVRRFEIISLGSMPFVSLDVSMAYSGIKLATGQSKTFLNPFSGGTEGYSEKEIKGIILTSLGISIGVGITDWIINDAKAKKIKERNRRVEENIKIYSVVNDPDAVKIELSDSDEENLNSEETEDK